MTVHRHSSAAQGAAVAAMMVPVPPRGPCRRVRAWAGPVPRTVGSAGTSSRYVTGTPNASLILARVARFGLERACSSATRTPLLTPDLAASWSSDQPRSARRDCRVRASAPPRSLAATDYHSLGNGRYVELDVIAFRPATATRRVGSLAVVIAFALAAAALFGSVDFLGGVASRRAKAASVLVISAPAGVLVIFGAAMLSGAPFRTAGLGWALAAGAAGGAGLIIFYGA